MTRLLCYLAGPPAAGKTSVMAALTAGCDRVSRRQPFRHDLLIDPATGGQVAAELGARREKFGGTDALPMNVSPLACNWLARSEAPPLVLGEGDRLAHGRFLAAAAQAGYQVMLAYLTASPDVLDQRCAARGSAQNTSWRAGRVTKALRLAEAAAGCGYEVVRLDTSRLDPAAVAGAIRAACSALYALPVPAGAVR
jgi:hypothetical protein